MHKTKIDWCDYTWNPIWGCRNNCPYCYARKTAERWGKSFEPHWMERNFQSPMPKEPARIFVNSMSDIMYWEPEWWYRVLDKIELNPQHIFIFLTQDPRAYYIMFEYLRWNDHISKNCWLGATATAEWPLQQAQSRLLPLTRDFLTFISIEPMLWPIHTDVIDRKIIEWIILGAETGNRAGKVVPAECWIQPFLELEIPLFMKRNLPWSGPWRKEFPA